MADDLREAFAMHGAVYDEFSQQVTKRGLSFDITLPHAGRPHDQFAYKPNKHGITATPGESALEPFFAHREIL